MLTWLTNVIVLDCVSCCVVNHKIRNVIFPLISIANLMDVMNQTKKVGSKAQKLQQV